MEVIYVRWPLRRPRNIDNTLRRIEVSMKRVRRHLTVFFWFRVLWQENNQGKAVEGTYEGRSSLLRKNVEVLVLRMNGRFRRCLWLLGRSFAMVGRGRTDLNSHLGHWRRLTASMRAICQRSLVAPLALFQNEDRGLWICRGSSLGRRDRLFQDMCSLDRRGYNWCTGPRNRPCLNCLCGRSWLFLDQGLADGGKRINTGSRRIRSLIGDDVDFPCSFLCQVFDPLGRRRRFDDRLGLLTRPFAQHSSLGPLSNDRFFLGRSRNDYLHISQRPTT
ncbi:hypothetical protein ACFX2I_017357 [Malus domestica]